MKRIKKLTLNKEVVFILGENDMRLFKGGTYAANDAIPPPCNQSTSCPSPLPQPAPPPQQPVINQGTVYPDNTCVNCPQSGTDCYESCWPNDCLHSEYPDPEGDSE